MTNRTDDAAMLGSNADDVAVDVSPFGNEGEGSRSADRAYRAKAEQFAKSGKVDAAAAAARESLSQDHVAGAADQDPGIQAKEMRTRLEEKREELIARWNKLKQDSREGSQELRNSIRDRLKDIEAFLVQGWENLTDRAKESIRKMLD